MKCIKVQIARLYFNFTDHESIELVKLEMYLHSLNYVWHTIARIDFAQLFFLE